MSLEKLYCRQRTNFQTKEIRHCPIELCDIHSMRPYRPKDSKGDKRRASTES